MDVRVCGPNLNDQSKGSFHVHRADCADLYQYGPGKINGGEQRGEHEMLVKNATVVSVVEAVYDNGILDERIADGQSRKDAIDDLVRDFWFAPCVGQLPYPDVFVYECWVSGPQRSHESSIFSKFSSWNVVQVWLRDLESVGLNLHDVIHIGVHKQDEYTP